MLLAASRSCDTCKGRRRCQSGTTAWFSERTSEVRAIAYVILEMSTEVEEMAGYWDCQKSWRSGKREVVREHSRGPRGVETFESNANFRHGGKMTGSGIDVARLVTGTWARPSKLSMPSKNKM